MSADLATISQETVDRIRKAQTQGITSSSGFQGIDLADVVSLVPCNTPLYDRTPRKTPEMGADVAQWKAQLNINNTQPNPFVGWDAGGQFVNIAEQDIMAKYQPVRVSGQVTKDAIARSRNYDDAAARSTASTMIQWRLADNKAMWLGQNFALPALGAVTLAEAAGAAVPSGTVIKVQARSGLNYAWGGSGVAVSATTASGSDKVTASWASVPGAVAYDVFVGGFYYTTTVVNTVDVTSVPTADAAVPLLPGLFRTVPTIAAADASYSSASYNGLLASLAGDVNEQGLIVTPGTGAYASGASFLSLNGGQLTSSGQGVTEIDEILLSIWGVAELSPDVMWMNAQEAQTIAERVLSTNAAVTFLDPNSGRQGITAGGSVARYLNKAAGGVPVEIAVDPHLPPGRIVFVTERVPYPDSGIVNATEVRTLQDVQQTPYGASLVPGTVGGGPRDVFDVSSIETFLHRAPVACGVLTDIKAG